MERHHTQNRYKTWVLHYFRSSCCIKQCSYIPMVVHWVYYSTTCYTICQKQKRKAIFCWTISSRVERGYQRCRDWASWQILCLAKVYGNFDENLLFVYLARTKIQAWFLILSNPNENRSFHATCLERSSPIASRH